MAAHRFLGYPEGDRRRASWDFLRQLSQFVSIPWCMLGDFNAILDVFEKSGGSVRPRWLINGFHQAVFDAGLIDIYMDGYPFTWFKSLGNSRAVEERLDRALANNEWFRLFPNAKVENLVMHASDHCLILLTKEPTQNLVLRRRNFKFKKARCIEPCIHNVVSND